MFDFLLAHRLLPDGLLRRYIRHRIAWRMHAEAIPSEAERRAKLARFAAGLRGLPIDPGPTFREGARPEASLELARCCFGPRLKFSCCWFERGHESLATAEEAMLRINAIRAHLDDGLAILDLGAGWGALSLWLAARYPNGTVTAVCRTPAEQAHLEAEAVRLGLSNLTALVADLNHFEAETGRYDRVLSLELFEQLKNWPLLLQRIAAWMKPDGLCFLQIFTHQRHAYHFSDHRSGPWLARRCFPGGMMPSDDLLLQFQEDLHLLQHWRIDGRHYHRTAELWRENLDANRAVVLDRLARASSPAEARRQLARWRLVFLTCAEMWGYHNGSEWTVSHYLLQKPRGGVRREP